MKYRVKPRSDRSSAGSSRSRSRTPEAARVRGGSGSRMPSSMASPHEVSTKASRKVVAKPLPKTFGAIRYLAPKNATAAAVSPPRQFRKPSRMPRRSTGMTLDIRNEKITPCMPRKNPKHASSAQMARTAHSSDRKKPARAMPSTIKRMLPPTTKPTGSTRLRCSMTVAPRMGDRNIPNDWTARAMPTASSPPVSRKR